MVALHTYSTFSFLHGVIPVQKLVERAKLFSLSAIALTDIEGMYGHVPFFKAAKEAGIKPILGAKLYLGASRDDYVIILAKNVTGYGLLCRLITQIKLSSLSIQQLAAKPDLHHVIIITPNLEYYSELPDDANIFYEIPLYMADKRSLETKLYETRERGIRGVITNPVVFLEKQDFLLQKVVSAIRQRKTLETLSAENHCDAANYFLDPAILENRFKEYREYLDNSDLIASQCNVDLEIGKYKYPVFPNDGVSSNESRLASLCYAGMHQRYSEIKDVHTQRMEMELSVIRDLHFVDYFLIVWDIVREAKRRGMMLIGRGSAANSMVSYCLGFTEIDPIKHNLYFERFLNKSRTSPPDVDLDFSWRERDEIVKYVYDKYGYERVAMISTTVTFRARSAFRETAKVFGFSNDQITPLAKAIPWTSAGNLENLPDLYPESKNLPFKEEPWKQIAGIASKLAGFPRHLSIHPSGLVISPANITNFVALEFASNKGLGLVITQPDMYSIEDIGLVKIDLLSQRSLGVLRDTLSRLQENRK